MDHNELLSTNYVTLLLGLILPKHSWTKKIAFGNVLWGDETKIVLFGRIYVQKIWHKESEDFFPKKTLKHGDGLMMFLGDWMTNCNNRNKHEDYFQQDNDPKHTAKSVKA